MTSQLYSKEERMCLGDNLENYPPAQLSWQPPPVTKCSECCYADHHYEACYAIGRHGMRELAKLYKENKNGITKSCPMWQQQNKDDDAQGDCPVNHLCNGRFVHLPVGEQCDKCGNSK